MILSKTFSRIVGVNNFFQLFDLPMAFDVDKKALTSKYYALSRDWHPDKFTLDTAEKQQDAMAKTSQINQGYKILKDDQLRIRHILDCLNAAPVEGQDKMPQEFLMEMMDINEAIMDYKMDPSESVKISIELQIDQYKSEWWAAFLSATTDFDFNKPDSKKISAIKEFYLKSKYLRRLKQNVENRDVEL